MNAGLVTLYKFILCDCAHLGNRTFAHSHITPIFRTKECTMPAQNSLKSLAGAVLDRTIPRTLSAQYKKEPAQYSHIAQKTGNLNTQIETVRAWLHRIDEPVKDHNLVLDKCRNDPEALEYFLKHAKEMN